MANEYLPTQGKLPDWIVENLPSEIIESTLFRFKITTRVKELNPDEPTKTQYKQVPVDILPFVDLDYDILEEQMQVMPAQYAFMSALYSEARMASALIERTMKARRGILTRESVREANQNGLKLNSDQIKVVIEADADLVKLDELFQKAQMQAGKLYHMCEAVKMKAELARSLAGFKRNEKENS